MARHQDPRVSFDVPRDWEDRSVVAYAAPDGPRGASGANLVLTRDKLREDEELAAYAGRHTLALAQRLDGFVLEAHNTVELDGRPAVSVSFASNGAGGELEQRMVIVQLAERQLMTVTVTAPGEDAAQLAPLFERILSSVRFATVSKDES